MKYIFVNPPNLTSKRKLSHHWVQQNPLSQTTSSSRSCWDKQIDKQSQSVRETSCVESVCITMTTVINFPNWSDGLNSRETDAHIDPRSLTLTLVSSPPAHIRARVLVIVAAVGLAALAARGEREGRARPREVPGARALPQAGGHQRPGQLHGAACLQGDGGAQGFLCDAGARGTLALLQFRVFLSLLVGQNLGSKHLKRKNVLLFSHEKETCSQTRRWRELRFNANSLFVCKKLIQTYSGTRLSLVCSFILSLRSTHNYLIPSSVWFLHDLISLFYGALHMILSSSSRP